MVEITYTNTRGDQIAHAQALLGDRLSSFAFYHYFWVLYWAAMAALGVYVSPVRRSDFHRLHLCRYVSALRGCCFALFACLAAICTAGRSRERE